MAEIPGIGIDPDDVDTNIVFFGIDNAYQVCDDLQEAGVFMLPLATDRIRAVTHLGIELPDVDRALTAIRRVVG